MGARQPVSGAQAIPWPYYMGSGDRAVAQFGETLENVAAGQLGDYIDDKTAEELNDLEVSLIKGWDDYRNWSKTHLDTPDVDGAEFKRQSDQWRDNYVTGLTTGRSRELGKRYFQTFVARKASQASEEAVKQQKSNAAASFASTVDWLQQVPDQAFGLDDIHEREEAIANAYDRAATDDIVPSDTESFLGGIREASRALWKNAILNAMKYDPENVEALLDDPDNFLMPDDERKLRSTWHSEQNATRIAQEQAQKRRQDENDRHTTALTLRTMRGAAEPGEEMTPAAIEKAMLEGTISEETGRMLWDRLSKPREADPDTRLQSYGAMARVTARLKRGEISPEYWKKVYDAHFQKLDEEDAEMFLDRAYGSDPYDNMRADAEKLASESIKPLFADDMYVPDEGESADLMRDAALGTVMRRLDEFVASQEALGKTVDRNAYRDEAREITRQVYREEYDRLHAPPKPEKPQKSRGYSVGMEVTGKDSQKYVVVKFDENGNPLFKKK